MRLTVRDLWERDLDDFGIGRRALITVLRIGAVVARGFARHQLTTRAGSLTYVTMFSLIPTLAVALAMFSAFGGLTHARDMLLSHLMDYLAVGVRNEVTRGVNGMLSNINGGAIGATGLLFVIISVFTLLSSIEDVFNDIWGVKSTRGYFERMTLYWTVVTVSPTLVVLGMSLPALLQRVVPLRWVLQRTGTFDVFFGMLFPWLFVVVGFSALYGLMTSRKITVWSALVGGIAGGTSWFAAAHAYGWYARTTVYYANIYGSLAAIPIFIFWLYLSWLLVFVGAQVAFAWQNLETYREEILSTAPSQTGREKIALRLLAEAAQRFVNGQPAAAAAELAPALHLSARAVNAAVSDLVDLGLLIEVGTDGHLVLSRDPRQLFPPDVLQGLREHGEQVAAQADDPLMARIHALYQQAVAAADDAWKGLNFADLAQEDATDGAEQGAPHMRGAARSARLGR